MNDPGIPIDDQWIRSLRGPKNSTDPYRPYHALVEKERTLDGRVEGVITIFLTNRECRFRCLMCDLWKNTTDTPVPAGAIPKQIEWALARVPDAPHIKLYNSANFFDPGAVPVVDYPRIAELVAPFKSVIVENHPNLTGERCLRFNRITGPALQVAMGLETVHPEAMLNLNKKMNPGDYRRAVNFLKKNGITTRTFILLNPPFVPPEEGPDWAIRSLQYAFESGTDCCTVIPTRTGNGALEVLASEGHFTPPTLHSLEEVLEMGIRLGMGPVFADTWDLAPFSTCAGCMEKRIRRIKRMNLEQCIVPSVTCECTAI